MPWALEVGEERIRIDVEEHDGAAVAHRISGIQAGRRENPQLFQKPSASYKMRMPKP